MVRPVGCTGLAAVGQSTRASSPSSRMRLTALVAVPAKVTQAKSSASLPSPKRPEAILVDWRGASGYWGVWVHEPPWSKERRSECPAMAATWPLAKGDSSMCLMAAGVPLGAGVTGGAGAGAGVALESPVVTVLPSLSLTWKL